MREYAEWQQKADRGEALVEGEEILTSQQLEMERLYFGLRTMEGAEVEPIGAERAVNAGWAIRDGTRIALTPEGWLRLDTLAKFLTLAPSR